MSEVDGPNEPQPGQPNRGDPASSAEEAKKSASASQQQSVSQGLDVAGNSLASQASSTGQAGTGFQRLLKKVGPVTVKTILDPDAMRKVFARKTAEMEVRLEELASSPQAFVPEKCVEKYRAASGCDSLWDNMAGSERVRYCQKCNLQVYDFANTSQEEAEELVFQREAKKNVIFFKRKDGKFLTVNCPIGSRNRMAALLSVGVSALGLLGLIVIVTQSAKQTESVMQLKASSRLAARTSASVEAMGKRSNRGNVAGVPAATPEQLATYAHQVELVLQRAYGSGQRAKEFARPAVLQLGLLRTGQPTGFMLNQSTGDSELDTYIVNTALSQSYPLMPYGSGAILLELKLDGDKLSVTLL